MVLCWNCASPEHPQVILVMADTKIHHNTPKHCRVKVSRPFLNSFHFICWCATWSIENYTIECNWFGMRQEIRKKIILLLALHFTYSTQWIRQYCCTEVWNQGFKVCSIRAQLSASNMDRSSCTSACVFFTGNNSLFTDDVTTGFVKVYNVWGIHLFFFWRGGGCIAFCRMTV